MEDNKAKLTDFLIDDNGNKLLILLIQLRIEYEIYKFEELLRLNQDKKANLIQKKQGVRKKIYRRKIDYNINRCNKIIRGKREWMTAWQERANRILNNNEARSMEALKQEMVPLVDYHRQDSSRILRLFLVLQEAILAPIFLNIDNLPKGRGEQFGQETRSELSKVCNFPDNKGEQIYKDTIKFYRECTEFWKKVLSCSVVGVAAGLLTAGLAAPYIATAIGSMMGLYGAAAYTAGLAFLGLGSIAAGGFGMTGGLTVIIGGGALLGAASGSTIAKIISHISKESVTVSLAKVINYSRFLSSSKGDNKEAVIALSRVKREFLDFKYNFEKEILLGSEKIDTKKKQIMLNTIHIAFKRLVSVD